MHPLVIRPAQHHGVLAPDQAPRQLEPGFDKGAAEIQALGIGVVDIDWGARHHDVEHGSVEIEQELAEVASRHGIVLDRQAILRLALVGHVVRWISHADIGAIIAHEPGPGLRVGARAAHDAVAAQRPDVAWAAHRNVGLRRCGIGVGGARGRSIQFSQQHLDLIVGETSQAQVVVHVRQIPQLGGEHRLVPARVQRQLVIGDHVGAFLGVCQVAQAQARHFGHAQPGGGQDAAVARNDAALGVNQDRVRETELPDRRHDLGHLRIAVRAAVARIRDKPVDGQAFNLHSRPRRTRAARAAAETAEAWRQPARTHTYQRTMGMRDP
ncbi:hypothetical protein CADE109221_11800 [Castellaniella denitrificans]